MKNNPNFYLQFERRQRSMGFLTEDLLVYILIRLPVKSIIRFRCVSKGWYELLTKNNLDFVKMKLKHDVESENIKLLLSKGRQLYSIDYDPLTLSARSKPSLSDDEIVEIDHPLDYQGTPILSTCDGLIFASSPDDYISLYIWNPVTKEYKSISTYLEPCPFAHLFRLGSKIGYGFGYDCGIEDYKVVAVITYPNSNVSNVVVYALGSNSWRSISSIPYRMAKGGPGGVFVNGSLHWLAQSCSGNGLQVLLSFDMEDEIFAEIQQPEDLDQFDYKFLGVLGGCLCMLCSVGKVGFEVWVMQDYGVRGSWTKLFKLDQLMTIDISSFHYLTRTVSLRNGEILLEIRLDGGDGTTFIVYDPKRERARVVKIPKKEIEVLAPLYEMDSYVESLVSVNSGSYFKDRNNK